MRMIILGVMFLIAMFVVAFFASGEHRPSLEEQIDYVARVIEAEAGGESKEGMKAVAAVIHNRSQFKRWTPYDVVTAHRQFAFPSTRCSAYARELSLLLHNTTQAKSVFNGLRWTHFYAYELCDPYWANALTHSTIIGKHRFGVLRDGVYSK